MEDVDEGFASNESNYSNPNKEDVLNELKYLNGQKVIDRNTNIDNLFSAKVCENGNGIIGKKLNDNQDTDSENDLDLRTAAEDRCHSNADDSNVPIDDENTTLDEVTVEELQDKSESQNKDNESDLPNDKGDNIEMLIDKIETENDSNVSDDQSNNTHVASLNGNHTTDSTEIELEGHEKAENSEINTLQMTPVKQITTNSNTEGERSPFFLDDKVRNSLKGLAAKVKLSEMSREGSSPSGSSLNGDGDGSLVSKKPQEMTSTDPLSKEDTEKDSHNKDTVDLNGSSITDPDESILADEDEGIPMEIGSENEDELLELDSETDQDKKCNNKEPEIASPIEVLDRCASTMSNEFLREETNSSTLVEIPSDSEDACEKLSEKNSYSIRHASVEIIQFEEDSNSNGSSGRINEIVNFLNHDLSGTNSPLTTSESSKKDECDSKSNDDLKIDIKDNGAKSDNEVVMEESSESEKVQDDTDNLVRMEDAAVKDKSKEGFSIKDLESSTVKPEESSFGKSQVLEKDSKAGDNLENIESELNDEKCHSPVQTQDKTSGQTELVSENKTEDDEDDDVIFEGATMPAMRNEYQTRALAGSNTLKPDENVLKTENKDTNECARKDEEDDDVIFEKETKLEFTEPKQNCDSVKTVVSANDTKEKMAINENSLSSKDSNVNNALVINSRKQTIQEEQNIEKPFINQKSDRKRSVEDKEVSENDSKRSKLDLTGLIGRLGSRVEPASIEVSDTDEEDEKTVAENETPVVSADDKKEKEEKKLITVTEKELEDLVREKVKLYLTSQRDTLVAKLSQKIKELQQNNDLWKRQVKDLQVKVNDVTVLQQKLEKRKAATAALRQITTRNVAVQVDEGRTASSKNTKSSSAAPRMAPAPAQVPFVSSPSGTGTIRLPIPQSSVTPALTTQHTQGSKMVTTTYQTPSVKSLLDTTRVQKTVGSVQSTATSTVGTSVLGLLQYPPTYVTKAPTSQGFVQQTVAQVPTQVSTTVAKTVTMTSSNASKVIDLTDDDDNTKTRLVALQPGINAVPNQQGVRHVLAPAGTQFVRTGLPNQPTYQLVFTSPPSAIRPGMMMSMASAVTQATTLLQTMPPTQAMVNTSTAVPSGTTLARAAVPATPTTSKAPVSGHPAPFPALPTQPTSGLKVLPPKPSLKISRVSQGIVLSWNMSLNDTFAEISNYQLFAYQETSAQPVQTLWKKVGDVKALPLPMACTLTQFQVGNKYHFAVRAMDVHNRVGQFSEPGSIHLTPNTPTK